MVEVLMCSGRDTVVPIGRRSTEHSGLALERPSFRGERGPIPSHLGGIPF